MRLVLLALAMVTLSACGSTKKSSSAGPCPERNEPLAGSSCMAEGTTCEYVVARTCETDEYACTGGKWALTSKPAAAAAASCMGPPHVDGGETDAALDAAIVDARSE